jgi:integrase
LRLIWNACADDDYGRIVKLLMLTGCRRDEVGALLWSELNLATGIMTIPGSRTKNNSTLVLPLPQAALDIINTIPRRDGQVFVFEGGKAGFNGWSYNKMLLITRLQKPLPHWALHDLRRTMRTGLGRLGIPPHVAELAINHVKKGMQAVYDRHTYQPQIKAALAAWAAHVAQVVGAETPARVRALRA